MSPDPTGLENRRSRIEFRIEFAQFDEMAKRDRRELFDFLRFPVAAN